MIKLVVFDMAGTTINEDNVVYKTLRESLENFGYVVDLKTVLAIGAGMEKFDAINAILREIGSTPNDLESKKIFKFFKKQLALKYDSLDVREMDGAYATIKSLKKKDVLIALNTGYDRKTAKGLLKKVGWKKGKDYHVLITATETLNSRPAPDMILLAMKKLGITSPSKVAKVGDSAIDILEGKNAKCGLTIGVTTGAQNSMQLATAKPNYIISGLSELITIIKN